VTGIFGPSGSGKTTLLNLLAGLNGEASTLRGRIELDGAALLDTAGGINVATHRRRIGMVFQEHRLFPHYTVAGNLDYGRSGPVRANGDLDRGTIVELLELGPLLGRGVPELSGGERQRVALGRALLASPRLLLLDEPLSSLDRRLKEQILPYLRRVRDAAAIPMVYVTHDLTELQRMTQTLIMLEQGAVLAQGELRELVHQPGPAAALRRAGIVNILLLRRKDGPSADELVELTMCSERQTESTTVLRIPEAELSLGDVEQAGEILEVAIRPDDVVLALDGIRGSSIQNQMPGVITRMSTISGRTMVEVNVGAPLLAEVSRRSSDSLGLREGMRVLCLIKSLAARRLRN
jgi:molybdate transport system ATP-binding protein